MCFLTWGLSCMHGACIEVEDSLWFSSATMWVAGIELRSSGLAANVFTHWATSLALTKHLLQNNHTFTGDCEGKSWALSSSFPWCDNLHTVTAHHQNEEIILV